MSKVNEMELLSDFSRFQVLLMLYEKPRHGYDILSEFRDRIGKEISPSRVYPFLQKLQEKGLVSVSVKMIGKKQKKVYELTPEGLDLCKHLFKRFATLVASAIEPSMEICANCGSKLFEGGHIETIANKEMVFCCEHCAKAYHADRETLEK